MLDRTNFLRNRWKDLLVVTETLSGKTGLAITCGLFLIAVTAPWLAPYPPNIGVGQPYAPPSWAHLLGTDDVGEDLLSQLIWGTRGSLIVGLSAAALSSSLGACIGLFSGYYGHRLGEGLMRAADVVLVLPLLPFLIVVAAIFPSSILLVIVVIGVLSWPQTARVIRSQTLTLKSRPFVDAARLSGMSDIEIMFSVLLPNMLALLILYAVYASVSAVVIESGLDFIGLGAISNLSWGIMLYFALTASALLRGSWWWFLPPGLMIALMGTGFILLGQGIQRVARIRTQN